MIICSMLKKDQVDQIFYNFQGYGIKPGRSQSVFGQWGQIWEDNKVSSAVPFRPWNNKLFVVSASAPTPDEHLPLNKMAENSL